MTAKPLSYDNLREAVAGTAMAWPNFRDQLVAAPLKRRHGVVVDVAGE